MLVLTRKVGESIIIDDKIKIQVVQVKKKQVRIGIEASKNTKIHREEIYRAIQQQNQQAAKTQVEETKEVTELLQGKGKKEFNSN